MILLGAALRRASLAALRALQAAAPLGIACAIAWIACDARQAAAQDEAPPDSAIKPLQTTYDTSYDRDGNRGIWTQNLSYGNTTKWSTFNVQGNVSTTDFLRHDNKSTTGSIDGALSMRTIGSLLAVVTGSFDMNSAKNGLTGTGTRDNKINLKLQQFVNNKTLNGIFSAYTEFQVKQDRTQNELMIQGRKDPAAPDSVPAPPDSSQSQRDSSYTRARMDGLNAYMNWAPRPALALRSIAQANQVHPDLMFFHRDFVHAIDSLGMGYSTYIPFESRRPFGTLSFDQWLTYTGIKRMNIVFYGQRRHQTQLYYDKQRNDDEFSSLDNALGTFHFDTSLLPRIVINTDASMGRTTNRYELSKNLSRLSYMKKALSTVSYADTARRATVAFSVDRTLTQEPATSAGVEINRLLTFNGSSRMSARLSLDALGSVNLGSKAYVLSRNDQDIQRTFASVGGGFLLAPTCSTTVHLSRSSDHTVNLVDPTQVALNAVNKNYQVNATLRFVPNRDFSLIQNYAFSANYRFLDYAEQQNSLSRTRRIDTDFADTLWSFAFVHLAHNFVYGDDGTYARSGDSSQRLYRMSTQHYSQSLNATAGLKILPGVLFTATQGLENVRIKALASGVRTVQNTFNLNIGLDVSRSFDDGLGVVGALRRIEQYTEHSNSQQRRDWVAGVSIHKAF